MTENPPQQRVLILDDVIGSTTDQDDEKEKKFNWKGRHFQIPTPTLSPWSFIWERGDLRELNNFQKLHLPADLLPEPWIVTSKVEEIQIDISSTKKQETYVMEEVE